MEGLMIAPTSAGSRCARRRRAVGPGIACAAAAATLLALFPCGARADTAATAATDNRPVTKSGNSSANTVTVNAQRDRAELQRKVNAFLSSVLVHHSDWALARWDQAVCPLIAGLSRDEGEFMLARLSAVVRAAGAPLAPEKCSVNFFVVLTPEPAVLLMKWRRRDPRLFDNTYGEAKVKRFINTPRPIRVWYNAAFVGSDGTTFYADSLPGTTAAGIGGMGQETYPINRSARGSRLLYDDVPAISSVIVIVDSNRVKGLQFGQLADYIAMIGLAEVNLDKNLGDAPTILHLFAAAAAAQQASLTPWDRAFLKALYGTPQEDVMQLSEMQSAALRYIAQMP
jgi:hypothetical protein